MRRCCLLIVLLLISQYSVCQQSQLEPTAGERREKTSENNALVSFPGLRGAEYIEVQQNELPLLIQYSPLINPKEMVVLLNGNDISGKFRPEVGREVVQIGLESGANELVVKARSLELEDDEQVQRLALFKREMPNHHQQGKVVRGVVNQADTKESMEELFRKLSASRNEK